MKPCSKNRKLITWLALGALETREAAAIREHLTRCEGCRRYWEAISNMKEKLASAEPDSDLEASEFFYRRVAAKLRAAEPRSAWESLAEWVTLKWRVALPIGALVLIALVAFIAPLHRPAPSRPAPRTTQVAEPSPESKQTPTIAYYRMVASQSLDQFDELLTRQGSKNLPPAPAYSASSLESATASF